MNLTISATYKRTDIHDAMGGQRQGGISTPKSEPAILIFSGEQGEAFGYSDGWREDGYFIYTGEGQVGDMEFIRGNLAIRDHQANKKTIHLFFNAPQRSHVIYQGEMRCVDWEWFQAFDGNGDSRSAIRFVLESNDSVAKTAETRQESKRRQNPPNTTESRGLITSRVGQGYYRQLLVEKFDGKCAVKRCGPTQILIASHIVPWREASDEERLDVENGILLSPNYDALFDRHLIGFEDDGSIVFSALLDHEAAAQLNILENDKIEVNHEMTPYLARHRSILFLK